MRRLEVIAKSGDSPHVNLTINDSRVTVKIPPDYAGDYWDNIVEFAQQVADAVPYYRYPTLRGAIFNAQYVRLRDNKRKFSLVFDNKEA